MNREETPKSLSPRRPAYIAECTTNEDCPNNTACVSKRCKDPCPTVCGNNSVCQTINHMTLCSCMTGYTGNAIDGCHKQDIAECTTNEDCPNNTTCVSKRCKDPCPTVCGNNSVCQTINHMTLCSCMTGYTGNAIVGCHKQDSSWTENEKGVNTEVNKKREYHLVQQQLTWTAALEYCQRQNGSLATVTSKEENDEIKSVIVQADVSWDDFWIGGTDTATEGSWRWVSTGQQIEGYTNWGFLQPNGGSFLNCLKYLSSNGKWYDWSCSYSEYFICEY